jgi:hypothetical protein
MKMHRQCEFSFTELDAVLRLAGVKLHGMRACHVVEGEKEKGKKAAQHGR